MKSRKKKAAAKNEKYYTKEQKTKTLKRKGSIITFKEPFWWNGERFIQIMVQGIEKEKGSVKIIGFSRNTKWFDSMKDLIKAVNWNLMEHWQS